MITHAVPLFMVALLVGLAPMALPIYQVNAWNIGTVKVAPWSARASASFTSHVAAVGSSIVRRLSALLGNEKGELVIDLTAIKSAVDESNRLFNEFKQTNETRLKAIENGSAIDPLIESKLAKISDKLSDLSKITDSVAQLEARMNRERLNGGTSDEAKKLDTDTKAFNLLLRGHARQYGREFKGDLTVEQYKEYREASIKFLRYGVDALEPNERRAMSIGSDPDGGYLVNPDLTGQVVKKLFETSPMRSICAQQTISTDALEGLKDTDEAAFGWVAEQGSRTATTTPQFGKWRIPVMECYANPGATQSLLDDSNIDVEAWLAGKVADKLARGTNTAFVVGTGVGQPRGFASYTTAATADASRAWGTLEHVATGTSGGYGTDPNGANKLIDLVHKLNANYRQGANWVMNRRTLGTTRKLTDGSGATAGTGNYLWLPSMMAGQPSTLLGYPVTEADDVVDMGANTLSVAFGNFGLGYQIVDRIGIRVLRDPYTNKPFVQFYTTARVGGDVIHFDAIKFIKFI